MTTSAQALNEILTVVHSEGPKEARFIQVTADSLGKNGEISEIEAAQVLITLYDAIEEDISSISIDDKGREMLRSKLSHFKGIKTFAHFHLSMQSAKQNFLKPDHLVGLTTIHLSLKKQVNRPELDEHTKGIANELRDIASRLEKSQMPTDAKEVLSRRLLQVSSAIDHFSIFGSKGLDESLQSLLGSMALYSEGAQTDEDKGILKKSVEWAGKVADGLKKADESFSAIYSLGNKTDTLIQMLPPGTIG